MSWLMPKQQAKASAPVAVPRRSDTAVQASAAEQRRKFFGTEGGRVANMLTGASGFSQGFSTGTAKLLGSTVRAA